MVKPYKSRNLGSTHLSKRAIKSNNDSKQRTLLQCWTKQSVTARTSNVIEVIEIEDATPCNSIAEPKHRATENACENRQDRPVCSNSPFGNSKFQKEVSDFHNKPQRQRQCPFYKRVGDAPYAVDAFNYAYDDKIHGYFLTHFHSDHYAGLGPRFSQPVYCSDITANLVRLKLRVRSDFIRTIPLDTPTDLPDGTSVRLLNSNHCPGAVLIVFRLKSGQIIIHTGDMRADEDLLRSFHAVLRDLPRGVDVLHLDTTYCDASFCFPSQSEVLKELVERIKLEVRQKPKLLILVGAYQIGKERVFQEIAEALNVKICVQKEKWNVLQCLKDAALCERLTLNPQETSLHVVPMNCLNNTMLANYLRDYKCTYDSIIGVSATGWECGRNGRGWRVTRTGNTAVFGVPYSEHSSYSEMKRFVQLVRPARIIPTVNVGSESKRKQMQETFSHWLTETKLLQTTIM